MEGAQSLPSSQRTLVIRFSHLGGLPPDLKAKDIHLCKQLSVVQPKERNLAELYLEPQAEVEVSLATATASPQATPEPL